MTLQEKINNSQVEKELAIFKKYGYTVEQIVNLDFYLTNDQIKNLPEELKTAITDFAKKMGSQTAPAESTQPNTPNLPQPKIGIHTPIISFIIGVSLGTALGYYIKKMK